MGTESEVLTRIASQTQSELILFFIIVAVIVTVVLLPLYKMMLDDRKGRREQERKRLDADKEGENVRLDKYIQREMQIIRVIQENSQVIAGLKVMLESSGKTVDRIHERIDTLGKAVERLTTDVVVVKKYNEHILDNQNRIIHDLQEIRVADEREGGV